MFRHAGVGPNTANIVLKLENVPIFHRGRDDSTQCTAAQTTNSHQTTKLKLLNTLHNVSEISRITKIILVKIVKVSQLGGAIMPSCIELCESETKLNETKLTC